MSISKLAMPSVGVPLIFQVPSLGFESPCNLRLRHSGQHVILLAHALNPTVCQTFVLYASIG
jgi:hypothetical protein